MKTKTTISDWLRGHVLGMVAIFIALSGTAYANHGFPETISSEDIIDAEVKNTDLAPDSIGSGKIIDGTVRSADVANDTTDFGLTAQDLEGGSVGTSEVANNSLAASDVADTDSLSSPEIGGLGSADVTDQSLTGDDIDESTLSGVPSEPAGPAGGDLAGTYPNPTIAANAIGSGEVAPDSLAAADLAPDSVASSEVAADTISTGEIIDGQVTHPDLGSNSVTGGNVFPSSLSGADIQANSLSSSDIGTAAVGSDEVAASAVGSSEVANASLGTAEFASSIPAVHVERTLDQGTNSSTPTTLNFNSERYDTAGMHTNTSPNFSRLTAPVTGIYEVTAGVRFAQNGSGFRLLSLVKNGTTDLAVEDNQGATGYQDAPALNVSTTARLTAGEFVEAEVFQNSGGNLSIRDFNEHSPEFSMTWLAPGPP